MQRVASLAGFLFAALVFGVVAPRPAQAHGGEQHGAAPAHQGTPASAAHARGNTITVVSPSCPGDHGSICTCGSALACAGGNAGASIAGRAAQATLVVPPAAERLERALPRSPPRPFALRFSRAPPTFS